MKSGIHPEIKTTKVHCNGCGTDFETQATVGSITVDICSNCHPFYTGKQKLVDTAGRVEKFKARAEAAKKRQAAAKASAKPASEDPEIKEIAEELEENTVDQPAEDAPKTDS